MAIYTVLDKNVVVSQGEYLSRSVDIATHLDKVSAGTPPAKPLELGGGKLLSTSMSVRPLLGAPAPAADGPAFHPVGTGLPLTVIIRHVYTGQFPHRGMFNHRGDMAVVSGVRGFSTFNASARALNFMELGVAPNSHFLAPNSFSQGTPVILYSPAVTDDAMTMSIEFGFADSFSRQLLDAVSSVLQTASGIPILLPYAGYLMGASSVVKLGEGVADALYQSQPPFQRTEVLNFALPGSPLARADFLIICNSALAADQYSYKDGAGLVDAQGKPYAGPEPYLVVSLDGAPNERLNGFTSTVASASVLQQFFQVRDGGLTALDTLKGALSVYSDLQYRQMAEKLGEQIKALPTGSAVPADLLSQWKADVANISDSSLKPAQPTPAGAAG
jgi:hypothetical protein